MFTRADLLTGIDAISEKELAALTEKLIAAGEPSDKVERAIAESAQIVEDHAALYVLDEERTKRLIRAIAIHGIIARLSAPSDKRIASHKAAMSELRDIRDGKFKHLLPMRNPAPSDLGGAGRGAFGSAKKINTR